MKYKVHKNIKETLALSRKEFVDRYITWLKEFRGGKLLKLDNPMQCPIAQWVVFNDAKCNKQMVDNTTVCPVCGTLCVRIA